MTINKSQEQTLKNMELDLTKNVSLHGKLYVKFLHAMSLGNVKVLLLSDAKIDD